MASEARSERPRRWAIDEWRIAIPWKPLPESLDYYLCGHWWAYKKWMWDHPDIDHRKCHYTTETYQLRGLDPDTTRIVVLPGFSTLRDPEGMAWMIDKIERLQTEKGYE